MAEKIPEKIFFFGKDVEAMTRDELLDVVRQCAKELKDTREFAHQRAMFAVDMMKLAARS